MNEISQNSDSALEATKIRLAQHYTDARDIEKISFDATLSCTKSMILINGGSVIASLTFVAHSPKNLQPQIDYFLPTIIGWFSAGLALSLAASFFLFIQLSLRWEYYYSVATNNFLEMQGHATKKGKKLDKILRLIYSVLFLIIVGAALVCFYSGVLVAVDALTSSSSTVQGR